MTDQPLNYATRRRERFKVRWWAAGSIVPAIVAAIVLEPRDGLPAFMGIILLSALAATVVYFISGRRAQAADLTFAILVLLISIAVCVLSWETSKLKADRIVMEKEARFAVRMKQATDAQNAFLNAGAISAAKLDEPKELERRIALLSELRSRMAAAVRAADSAEANIARQLGEEHVLRWHRAAAIARFNRDTQWSYYAGTMHVTQPFYDSCAELLDYLQAHRDEWSITPGVNNIQFKTPAAKARVDALRATIQSAAAEVQGAPMRPRRSSTTRSATTLK